MANGTKEKWDPGEPRVHWTLFYFVCTFIFVELVTAICSRLLMECF